MRKFLFLILGPFAGYGMLSAQPLQKAVRDAFMISRMVEKFHVQPRPLDDSLSAVMYAGLLEELDEQRILFTQEDIRQLSAYRFKLDDEVRGQQPGFLQLFTSLYKQRLLQADTMVDKICATPFNFSIKEKPTAADYAAWPAGVAGMHAKLYKLLKYSVQGGIAEYTAGAAKTLSLKSTDSLERVLRKRAGTSVKRFIKRLLQSPQGIEYIIGNDYCQALASAYDPHTAYFPPEVKDAFESSLGNKPLAFGLALNEDENGNAQIGRLKPGSPAFQSGVLNEGDKIQSVQWNNNEPIDVSNAELSELDQVLSDGGDSKATLSVKKADGTTRQVVLHKERLETDDEDDKVRGFILQGAKTIGYISLPAFYSDWEDSKGVNGCANDVARQILKLKKENIQGLILDLRYNGGGSVQEAIELSGLFIDAGPVAQYKTREAKVVTLKDINRGTVYDGPLLVLVNGYSASASEMVAGTLQDYNRALIAGVPTYGKATGQIVLPMDTTVDLSTYDGHSHADSYIKITTSRLYRITGATAQVNGIKPQIELPEPADALQRREKDEKNVLPPGNIEANKYYKPLPPLPVAVAETAARTAIDVNGSKASPAYTVVNQAYEKQRLQADSDLKEMNEEWKNHLLADQDIRVAYQVLLAMIK